MKAPECFEIEEALRDALSIPVFHDDQHGTAIVVGAALLNGLEIQRKVLGNVRVVIAGAGAAGIACAAMVSALGVGRDQIVLVDSRGVVRYRTNRPESVRAKVRPLGQPIGRWRTRCGVPTYL